MIKYVFYCDSSIVIRNDLLNLNKILFETKQSENVQMIYLYIDTYKIHRLRKEVLEAKRSRSIFAGLEFCRQMGNHNCRHPEFVDERQMQIGRTIES